MSELINAGDPEPPVGEILEVGSQADHLVFVHEAHHWTRRHNGGPAERIGWSSVEFWAPLRRAA